MSELHCFHWKEPFFPSLLYPINNCNREILWSNTTCLFQTQRKTILTATQSPHSPSIIWFWHPRLHALPPFPGQLCVEGQQAGWVALTSHLLCITQPSWPLLSCSHKGRQPPSWGASAQIPFLEASRVGLATPRSRGPFCLPPALHQGRTDPLTPVPSYCRKDWPDLPFFFFPPNSHRWAAPVFAEEVPLLYSFVAYGNRRLCMRARCHRSISVCQTIVCPFKVCRPMLFFVSECWLPEGWNKMTI